MNCEEFGIIISSIPNLPFVFKQYAVALPFPAVMFSVPESKTLSGFFGKDAVMKFLAIYQYVTTGKLELAHKCGISINSIKKQVSMFTKNPTSVQNTIMFILAEASRRFLDIQASLLPYKEEAIVMCLLAHYHDGWKQSFIQHHKLNMERTMALSRIIVADIGLYCFFLRQVDVNDVSCFRDLFNSFVSMPDHDLWCLAFLHVNPSAIFRAMGWFPTLKQRVQMANLLKMGTSPGPLLLFNRVNQQ